METPNFADHINYELIVRRTNKKEAEIQRTHHHDEMTRLWMKMDKTPENIIRINYLSKKKAAALEFFFEIYGLGEPTDEALNEITEAENINGRKFGI